MQRAHLERRRSMRKWHERVELDASLQPGHFRKSHRPLGCPRFCPHCRAIKDRPTRQQRIADLALRELLRQASADE